MMTVAWLAVRQFLGGNVLIVGVCTALLVAVVGWDSSRKARWTESGRQEVRVETQKANDAAVQKSDSVRARVQSGIVRNAKRDPYSID